jgi:hypothetical protein
VVLRVEWISSAFDEQVHSWCYAADLETFEQIGMESAKFWAGTVRMHCISHQAVLDQKTQDCDPDLQDDVIWPSSYIASFLTVVI